MKEIKLSQQGKNKDKYVALVDDEDFERVNQFRWNVVIVSHTCYSTGIVKVNGEKKITQLHSFIMGEKWIDHIDHDGLNCQKYNMRPCTHQQNMWNKSKNKNKNTSSKYKGVYFKKDVNKWAAIISFNDKLINIGRFDSEIRAAKAYNLKAKKLFKEFANLNPV